MEEKNLSDLGNGDESRSSINSPFRESDGQRDVLVWMRFRLDWIEGETVSDLEVDTSA